MSETANAFESLRLAANTQTAFRLMQAASFELTFGQELVWLQSHMARHVLRGDVPRSVLQLSQGFTQIKPRFSAASLSALIPGAQGRWSAEIDDETGDVRYYDMVIERNADNAAGEAVFSGFLRDVTQERQDLTQQSARREADAALGCLPPEDFQLQASLLKQLSATHCQDAALLTFCLRDVEGLNVHYGAVIVDHVHNELLRRIKAFLPHSLSLAREGARLKCLLADVDAVDVVRLSQALTSFPITTPQGPIMAELDVDIKRLNEPDNKPVLKPIRRENKGPAPITENDIIALLNQRSLSLALQPICHANTGELHHYEALMRIDDPLKGPQSAWRHILAAEDFGLIHLLDYRALERAALLMIRYPHIHVALNISAGTVCDIDKQDEYLDQLDAFPALHDRLTIEMTETMALAAPDLAAQFAERLRARGCHLSIDDFGAGHTSFKTLMSTEASQIKLDGSLIEGICRSVSQQNFVRLMVDFAATFDVTLVAERIETAEERLLLASLGVDYLQGYYLGRPISEHDFTGRLPRAATSSPH